MKRLLTVSLVALSAISTIANATVKAAHDGTSVISNSANVIATADKDAGMGTWFERFDKTDTSLMIPAGNTAGSYQANLVWTLTDAAKA